MISPDLVFVSVSLDMASKIKAEARARLSMMENLMMTQLALLQDCLEEDSPHYRITSAKYVLDFYIASCGGLDSPHASPATQRPATGVHNSLSEQREVETRGTAPGKKKQRNEEFQNGGRPIRPDDVTPNRF